MENLEILNNLEKEIEKDNSKLSTWNINYFRTHNKRYLYDLNLLNKYYKSGRILEVGSAPYHLTYILDKMGYPITGIDISPERHTNFISEHSLDIVKCDIEKDVLPFGDNEFYYIIFNEIFEHLRINPIKTLKEVNRVLHPSGFLILTTPNLYSIRNIINYMRGKGFDSPYEQFLKLETVGHMGHVREYSVSQVKEFLQNTGFRTIKVERKSHTPMIGLWRPFNLLRRVFPVLSVFQIHICKKVNQ